LNQAEVDPALWSDALLRLCLVAPDAVPDAPLRASAAMLGTNLSARDGQPVPNPAILSRNLRAVGLMLPVAAHRRLEALAMREEKRSAIAAEQCAGLERLFGEHGIGLQSVRGWHFARTFYPDPLVRHCHALRWLASYPSQAQAMATLLASAGWNASPASPVLSPHKQIFTGTGRITAELHVRPFGWSPLGLDAGDEGDPAFVAAELIGATVTDHSAASLRSAIDLVHLLRRAEPDPRRFAHHADRFGFAGHAAQAVAHVARLAHAEEEPLRSRLAALRGALERVGARDSAAVRDIRLLRRMGADRRSAFLLRSCIRPDLFGAGRKLRAENHVQRVGGTVARASLLQLLRGRAR